MRSRGSDLDVSDGLFCFKGECRLQKIGKQVVRGYSPNLLLLPVLYARRKSVLS